MDYRLVIVIVFTAVIHIVNTLAYSVRLAGVRTKSLAIANSMWNVIFIIASTANTIQAPFLGKMIDSAGRAIKSSPGSKDVILSNLNFDIRLVILASTIGSILGIIFMPSFVKLFMKGIEMFNEVGSVPRIILRVFLPKNLWKMLRLVRVPSPNSFFDNLKRVASYKILISNTLIWGLFTTGILSSMYAGAVAPDLRSTSVTLSSIVNGVATVLLFTIVDPFISAVTDQALRGERTDADVKSVTLYMSVTRMLGTILAQVFFVPATMVIVYVAKLI